jgi:hypothetical protein
MTAKFNNPDLKRGLGIGVGRAYGYLSDQARAEAFQIARDDIEFATGLGHGIGTIIGYLDQEQKKSLVISYIGENGFTRGFGIGAGSVFPYLTEESKREILDYSVHTEQLSLGLGVGIGMRIPYFAQDLLLTIIELAKNNPHLATGLGEGCGCIFPNLSSPTKELLLSTNVKAEDRFAFGFGVGIGRIRRYLDKSVMEEAEAIFASSIEFYKGLAVGLGRTVAHLSADILAEISKPNKREFMQNFGFSFGHALSSLDANKRKEVLEAMKNNEDFLAGLGEGAGHYLPVTGGQILEEIILHAGSTHLERGAAAGVTESFNYLDLAEIVGILEYASSHVEFGKVLGEGLAGKFASLDEDKKSQILDALQKDSDFATAFVRAISKNSEYIPAEWQARIRSLVERFSHQSSPTKGKWAG